MALTAGTRLGAYKIVSAIGAGGMGEVYRARDLKLDRDVAVKVLPPEFAARATALARFEREARAVAALSHPNILSIHDFGVSDGTAFAVTELLDGETLRNVLDQGPIPLRRTLEYTVQIAHALASAHDRGIVHRDVKPENLFVTSDGRIKLLDFGLARQETPASTDSGSLAPTLQEMTQPGTVLGTIGYMAPEQVRCGAIDARADLFAFGAVLYEMITGQRAFDRETAAETLTMILREEPPEPPPERMIPPELDRIIRHCLEKKPEARFHSAHDLAFALETVSASSAPTTRPAAVGVPGGSREWWKWVAGAALLVALALGAGFFAGRRGAGVAKAGAAGAPPTFQRLSFGRNHLYSARFAPDGQTVVYGASTWGDRARRTLFLTRLEAPGATPISLPTAVLFGISPTAELALGLDARPLSGQMAEEATLAYAPLLGGAPRRVLDHVSFADWSPAGGGLAIVRIEGSRQRLEYPPGKTLYETDGEIGSPRVSPAGDRVAFLDWPVKSDDRGTVAVVDPSGVKRTISPPLESVASLAWTPAGDEVWYSAAASSGDYAIWGATLDGVVRRIYSAPGGMLLQDFTRDGRALVVLHTRTTEVSGWLAGEAQERDLSWLDYSLARDVSPDGRRVLLTFSGEGCSPNYDIFVRPIDSAEAMRIGEGQAQQFSPDGQSVLSVVHGPPTKLQILPIGVGEPKVVGTGEITPTQGRFLGDGRRLLVIGTEPGKGARAYVIGVDGSHVRALTPEGITYRSSSLALSPDGTRIALRSPEGRFLLYSTDGGDPLPIEGLSANEVPIAWSGDGRELYVAEASPPIRHIVRLDPATGRRALAREFSPLDPALRGPLQVFVSPDGRTYVANYEREQMALFLVEGLR